MCMDSTDSEVTNLFYRNMFEITDTKYNLLSKSHIRHHPDSGDINRSKDKFQTNNRSRSSSNSTSVIKIRYGHPQTLVYGCWISRGIDDGIHCFATSIHCQNKFSKNTINCLTPLSAQSAAHWTRMTETRVQILVSGDYEIYLSGSHSTRALREFRYNPFEESPCG